VDGGVLSNYPIWVLDDGTSDPSWPTFGFKRIEADQRRLRAPTWNPIGNVIGILQATISTMLETHDRDPIPRSKETGNVPSEFPR
jgi:NTE family protein